MDVSIEHIARDAYDAARKESVERGWLFLRNDVEYEQTLQRCVDAERRRNQAQMKATQTKRTPDDPRAQLERQLAGARVKLADDRTRRSAL